MKCSQSKPFTMTSTNPKMGGAAIKSYEKGGMVTKSDEPSSTSKMSATEKARLLSTAQSYPRTSGMSATEKVLSYPARVAVLGGLAAGAAADQAVYNSGVMDKNNPRFTKTTREGKGYESAKKLARMAVGIDSLDDETEDRGKK